MPPLNASFVCTSEGGFLAWKKKWRRWWGCALCNNNQAIVLSPAHTPPLPSLLDPWAPLVIRQHRGFPRRLGRLPYLPSAAACRPGTGPALAPSPTLGAGDSPISKETPAGTKPREEMSSEGGTHSQGGAFLKEASESGSGLTCVSTCEGPIEIRSIWDPGPASRSPGGSFSLSAGPQIIVWGVLSLVVSKLKHLFLTLPPLL